ncbi:unnamed protein product [Owenia fusiformis]|uniref:Uncharacterized protein n=1 Tax=Owenia fusiformis TaxID=6347 RepID=A0A8J1TWL9_OWEFU|nr:unnamed protein product [Owenia fusiformis]
MISTENDPAVEGDDKQQSSHDVRFDDNFHNYVTKITESTAFNAAIMTTIFCNALLMALETDMTMKQSYHNEFFVLEEIFLSIYTIEFIMKVYAEPKGYWRSGYNLFDFLVLSISFLQDFLALFDADRSGLDSLRVLRALRTFRTLRSVSFIKGLQVLVTALIDTIRKSVVNIVMLLLLMMFLFGIMGYYLFGYREDGDKEHFGHLGAAMLTLFTFVTVDGWTDLQDELDRRNMVGSRVYTISFIIVGHFIFTNVFIAVIIMNISEATENYKRDQIADREATVRHKKEFMMQRQHNEVKQMIEQQKKGDFSNFHDMVGEFQHTLRHNDCVMMTDLCTNLVWIETFVTSLEHMDNTTYRIQQLNFELSDMLTLHMENRLRQRYGFGEVNQRQQRPV